MRRRRAPCTFFSDESRRAALRLERSSSFLFFLEEEDAEAESGDVDSSSGEKASLMDPARDLLAGIK